MSWPGQNQAQWNQAGIAMPDMSRSYTPEQWALMQQQNWQQWSQWQQQYSQWHNHYGDEYAQLHAVQSLGGVPPPPPSGAAPPPPPDKPPPPPHENNQPLFVNKENKPAPNPPQQRNNANHSTDSSTGNNQWSYSADTQQPAVNSEDLKKLAEEERLFDIQFQKWEEEIDKWRQENVNHPDKQAYKDYEAKFEACRKQLLERRQHMNTKRANLLNNPALANTGNNTLVAQQISKDSNQNSYSQKPPTQNSQNKPYERPYIQAQNPQSQPPKNTQNNQYDRQYDSQNRNNKNIEPQDRFESYNQNAAEDKNKSYPSHGHQAPKSSQSDPTFLQSSSAAAGKGIPGLDLVPDVANKKQEIIDLSDENAERNAPDYSTISMGINNILGDEKIMNILSMVQGIKPTQGADANNASQGNRPQNFNQPQSYAQNITNKPGQIHDINKQFQHPNQGGNYNRPDSRQQENYFDQNNQFGPNRSGLGGQGGPRGPVRPSMPQGGPNIRQGGPGIHQARPGMNQGGPGMNQGGPGMNQGGPGMNQGGPGMNQGGPGVRPHGPGMRPMRPSGPGMQQGQGPNIQGGPNMQQYGPMMHQGGPNMHQSGPNMHQNGPNMNQGGLNMQQVRPNMQHGRPNMQHGGPNMQHGGPNMQHGGPNMQHGGPNMQHGGPNMQHGGSNMQQGSPNMQQGAPNMQQPQPLMAQRIAMPNTPVQPNTGPARPPLQDVSSQQNYVAPQPAVPPQPPKHKWVEDPLFTPSIIVEYEHKSLRLKARDFIEPVHTFDYNHISKDDDYKKKDFEHEADDLFIRKPRRSERDFAEDRFRDLGNRDLYSRDYDRKGMRDDFRDMPRDIREIRGESREIRDFRDLRDAREPRMFREREPREFNEPRDFREREIGGRNSRDRMRDGPREDLDSHREDRYGERKREDLDRHGNRRVVSEDMRERDRRSRREGSREGRRDDYRDSRRDENRGLRGNDKMRSHSRDGDSRKRGMSHESEISNNSKKAKDSKDVPINKPLVMIDDLLEPPGRAMRHEKIVVILRGLPGSGKSYLAKLIRDREAEHGGTARIMSIDDYFMQEGEIEETDPTTGKTVKKPSLKYEFDASLEETYTNSLQRAFKRSITDGYFSFLIYDAPNITLQSYAEIWNYSRQNGFQVYICTMEQDLKSCFKRQIHNRKLEDLEVMQSRFYPTPAHHIQLDATTLLQSAAIEDVQMEDVDDVIMDETEAQDEVESVFTSKWEKMDDANKLARLDGTSKPLRPSSLSMEEFLQLDDWTPNKAKPGKKSVRWADLEERREQEKMRAIGFVVGQTDWNRMTDPTMGSSALTQTKYIERVKRK